MLEFVKRTGSSTGSLRPHYCLLNILNPGEIQIHLFCDASIVANETVEYTRCKTNNQGYI
jgi:hypothetical protein